MLDREPVGGSRAFALERILPVHVVRLPNSQNHVLRIWDASFRKPTAIMTNLGSIKLNPPCLGETKCEYKKLHDNHEEFCGYDGVPREISKLHPPSLVKSLDEQMEDDLYGLINEILFLR